jgi:hypothetical protein
MRARRPAERALRPQPGFVMELTFGRGRQIEKMATGPCPTSTLVEGSQASVTVASCRCHELEPERACDDQQDACQARGVRGLPECDNTDDHRAGRSDAGPDGISGAEGDGFQRRGEESKAQRDRNHGCRVSPSEYFRPTAHRISSAPARKRASHAVISRVRTESTRAIAREDVTPVNRRPLMSFYRNEPRPMRRGFPRTMCPTVVAGCFAAGTARLACRCRCSPPPSTCIARMKQSHNSRRRCDRKRRTRGDRGRSLLLPEWGRLERVLTA